MYFKTIYPSRDIWDVSKGRGSRPGIRAWLVLCNAFPRRVILGASWAGKGESRMRSYTSVMISLEVWIGKEDRVVFHAFIISFFRTFNF